MRLSSHDEDCRYLAAVGTQTDRASPFGAYLNSCGVELPPSLPLSLMVSRGWIVPRLRVALPEQALVAWKNFATVSPMELENCPPAQEWALDLWVHSTCTGYPRPAESWWLHRFDTPSDLLGAIAREHATSSYDAAALPATFRHPHYNQLVYPWIDYFAYWQAFQIMDYINAMLIRYAITDRVNPDQQAVQRSRDEHITRSEQRLESRWRTYATTFDWLSRMRAVMGASTQRRATEDDIDAALHSVMNACGLTVDAMKSGVRETLLAIWETWTPRHPNSVLVPSQLLERLREDIQYAVHFIERTSDTRVDFRHEEWTTACDQSGCSRLIEALPYEDEVARIDFPARAEIYLRKVAPELAPLGPFDESHIESLVDSRWEENRALRRFVLAFHRLHHELAGESLMAERDLIRKTECIEQFNLILLNAERAIRSDHRSRTGASSHADVRKLLRASLEHTLQRHAIATPLERADAVCRARELLKERADLYELTAQGGLPFVASHEVGLRHATLDTLTAACVNFVIARNYAAHHDVLDWDLVYPSTDDTTPHPGGVALTSALIAVLTLLAPPRPAPTSGQGPPGIQHR